jgi:1-acyl-sn-glycerol-3-phosphate acyltransferase
MLIRALFFNIFFYGSTAVLAILAVPTLLLPYKTISKVAHLWSAIMVFFLKYTVGITHRIEGPRPNHQVIYAAKHQSAWETIFLYAELNSPAPVLKRELIFIPLIGQYISRVPSVPIDRSAGRKSLKKLLDAANKVKLIGDSILIFPQGSRVAPGAYRPYYSGTFAIYQATGMPVVPIALNSGIRWRRASFFKTPGVIDVRLLPEIPPGLDRRTFMARLESDIETATYALLKL